MPRKETVATFITERLGFNQNVSYLAVECLSAIDCAYDRLYLLALSMKRH